MERKIKSEGAGKISVLRIKKSQHEEPPQSEGFALSPLSKFQDTFGECCDIDGVLVGVVVSGSAKATINDRHFELRPNTLFLLNSQSTVQSFRTSKACMGYVISFSSSFLQTINVDMADRLGADMLFGMKPCIQIGEDEVARLYEMASVVGRMSGLRGVYGERTFASLSNSLFYLVASIVNQSVGEDSEVAASLSRGDELMHRFAGELASSCHRERSVEYYASCLGITPKYLSLVCKKRLGRNASKVIDDAVISKSKELLALPGLSVQEVAERMNFVSQSFFGKYFKQRTGVSPSRYKVQGYI